MEGQELVGRNCGPKALITVSLAGESCTKTLFCLNSLFNLIYNNLTNAQKIMASTLVSQSAVLFVDNVQVGTLKNRLSTSLKIPSVVPLPFLPIFSEDGSFLTLQVPATETRFELFLLL
jgi:hypothetical protein